MTTEELQACREGYIYVHDMSARRDTMNCCLFDVRTVFTGGFEMGNVWYNEPKTLDTAFDVIGDVTLSAASQQYGGFTLPEIDTVLEPYAQKSYDMYYEKYLSVWHRASRDGSISSTLLVPAAAIIRSSPSVWVSAPADLQSWQASVR